MQETVLVYIENEEKYLLLFRNKKSNDYNHGKYIGIGGKIEPGETKEQALIREVKEETGLNLKSHQYRGIVHFSSNGYDELMHLYTSSEYTGKIHNCNEGDLCWVYKTQLHNIPMWEGDYVFLEKLANNEPYFEITLKYEDDELIEVIDHL